MQVITPRKDAPQRTSRFVGISWDKKRGAWWAKLSHKGRRYDLGIFSDEVAAARVWNEKAKQLGKDILNVIEGEESR